MQFKVGDKVRVKPREWMDALPKCREGQPVTPDGGILMPHHTSEAGKSGIINDCREMGGVYALSGYPYYFPESCLELVEEEAAI
ncbi:hypothetical protein AGMMS4952_11010 [Spirochaetia bacterium]|nr:hypothetical protein AGMMS4952_11010 [Spirochaetia bacterium]